MWARNKTVSKPDENVSFFNCILLSQRIKGSSQMGVLSMSDKERLRKSYMDMVLLKKLNLPQVSKALQVSYRQTKRLYKAYKREKDHVLVHKSRGQDSNRQNPLKQKIIGLYKSKY